jgi:hypothetical protein
LLSWVSPAEPWKPPSWSHCKVSSCSAWWIMDSNRIEFIWSMKMVGSTDNSLWKEVIGWVVKLPPRKAAAIVFWMTSTDNWGFNWMSRGNKLMQDCRPF